MTSSAVFTVPLNPNRDLLNVKFEGYKLKLFDDKKHLKFYNLPPPGVSISKIPSNSKLSYKEIQSRIHFNHLFCGFEINDDKATCFYFDLEDRLILIEYDKVQLLFLLLLLSGEKNIVKLITVFIYLLFIYLFLSLFFLLIGNEFLDNTYPFTNSKINEIRE